MTQVTSPAIPAATLASTNLHPSTFGVRGSLRPARPSISCVLPAHNEAKSLPELLSSLHQQLSLLSDTWEIVLVNDGSTDDTAFVVLPWLQQPGLVYLELSRNFGKEAALTAGLDHAQGDVVILMDADLQHPIDTLPLMLARWQAGVDMVYAVREHRQDEPWWKRLGSHFFYSLINAGTRLNLPVGASDFRLFDRCVVNALKQLPERNRFMKGLYSWVGFRSEALPYTPSHRYSGQSHFSARSLAALGLTGLTAFSTVPLRVWSSLGVLMALASIAYGFWVVIDYFLYGSKVSGWSTVVTSIMFLSGIQLISVGILGEYLGRVYDEVKRRPIYLVARTEGSSNISLGRECPAVSSDF